MRRKTNYARHAELYALRPIMSKVMRAHNNLVIPVSIPINIIPVRTSHRMDKGTITNIDISAI